MDAEMAAEFLNGAGFSVSQSNQLLSITLSASLFLWGGWVVYGVVRSKLTELINGGDDVEYIGMWFLVLKTIVVIVVLGSLLNLYI